MSFTFNGESSTGYLVDNNVEHSILPSLSLRLIQIPRRAGAYDFGVDIGIREIKIDVTIKGTSANDLRLKVRNIANWLYQETPKPLIFGDEAKTYYARLSGETNLNEIVKYGQGTLTFICADPFAYGATTPQTITSGATVNNAGTVKTHPAFTITFSSSQSSLRVSCGTSFVLVTDNFVNGDILIVDCEKGVVTKNGTRIMDKIDLISTFFALEKGNNVITFTPGTGFTASILHTAKYL